VKLVESYKNNLDNNSKEFRGGFVFHDTKHDEVIIEDVSSLSFKSLYPTLIIMLNDAGIFNIDKSHIEKLRYFLHNKETLRNSLSATEYASHLYEFNSFYGKLHRLQQNSDVICQYLNQMYNDLLKVNEIYYIDTDIILYKGEINLLDNDLPFDIEKLKFLYIERVKNYITLDSNNKIATRGYGKIKKNTEIINLFKNKLRQQQIDKLVI
jgi:hypothetical protein